MATQNSADYSPTQYDVQIGGVNGTLVSVTNGTTGQVLTANTGAAPTFQNASGALVLIQTLNATNQATLNFTTGITTTYNNYRLIFTNYTAATAAGQIFWVSLSTNGGSTWITSGYAGLQAGLQLFFISSPLSDSNSNGYGELFNMTSGTGYVSGTAFLNYVSYFPSGGAVTSGGAYDAYKTASTVVNAIQIVNSDGSNFSGTFSLYGYTK